MRDYNAMCQALAETAATIGTMRGYATVPAKVQVPCIIVAVAEDGPSETFTGMTAVKLHLLLLVSRSNEESAQIKLNDYRSTSTSESVINAFEADQTVGGTMDAIVWQRTNAPAKYEVGGVEYYGAEFEFEALAE